MLSRWPRAFSPLNPCTLSVGHVKADTRGFAALPFFRLHSQAKAINRYIENSDSINKF